MKNIPKISFFLATSGHSGVDRAMKNLIPALANRGYKVELLKVRKHGPELNNTFKNIKIINLKTSHVYSSFFPLVKYLIKTPPHIMFTDKDRVNRCAILAKLITRAKTKLIVRSGITISVDLSSRGFLDSWIQRTSMSRLYKYADKIIVPSKNVAEDMSDYTGLSINHIKVVPPPVIEESIFTRIFPPPEHPWFKPDSPPVILGAGELCMRKDFFTLLKAFKIVKQHIDSRLVILGKGRQHDALVKFSHDLGIEKYVDFPGFKKDPYPYMAHAKVFVLTSLWEGLGFVLIESLAVGTPVVSTNCPSGPSEILENGKYGHLVPIKDHERLAEAILDTIKNPKEPEFLQQAARPYTIKASTDAHLKVFGLPPYWDKQDES